MKNKALVVWVIALLLFGMAVGAQAESVKNALFSSGDWSYRVRSDGSLEIAKWKGEESELVIPATIDGKKVSAIGTDAFYNCRGLTRVTIPEGVISIGNGAFSRCERLTSVIIPDSVSSIESNPFERCNALQLSISPEHPTFALIDDALIYKPEKRLIAYLNRSAAEAYAIPEGILSIGEKAFSWCDKLPSVTIPDTVTCIGNDAFSNCQSLTSIVIPDSVTRIGYGAFAKCVSLTGITIPDGVTRLENSVFYRCESLPRITFQMALPALETTRFPSVRT